MHFIREKVLSEQLQVNHVSGCDQVTDALTKALSVRAFTRLGIVWMLCLQVFFFKKNLKGEY